MQASQLCLFFDYDLTLYGVDEKIVLDRLDQRITRFIIEKLKLDHQNANLIRKEYCKTYGTTLGGLMHFNLATPQEYFDFLHTGEELVFPRKNLSLQKTIESLRGSKFIFTNGRADWVEKGLESMGMLDLFDSMIDIEALDWEGKPWPSAYQKTLKICKIQSKNAVLFDDKEENVLEARKQGWQAHFVTKENPLEKILKEFSQ